MIKFVQWMKTFQCYHPMLCALGILFVSSFSFTANAHSVDATINAIDLELDLTVDNDQLIIYSNRTYTLTVSNNGTQSATGVIVDFPLPDNMAYTDAMISQGQYSDWTGIWKVGSIGAGQSATLDLTLFTLTEGVTIVSYAQVTGANQQDCDSSPSNGTCCTPNEDDEATINISPDGGGNTGGGGGGGSSDLPDLTITNLSGIPTSIERGSSLTFSYNLNNDGSGTATEQYYVNYHLSVNNTFSFDDQYLGQVSALGTLGGSTTNVTSTVNIPSDISGDYYFIVQVDVNSDVAEANEFNNTAFQAIEITVPGGGGGGNTGGDCLETLAGFSFLGSFQNSNYFISNDERQPATAQANASSLGGNLVAINSAAENDFIFNNINGMTYIGLNDANQEGNLTWANGDAVSYSNYDLCDFCNVNDAENDYVIMHPWNGGWSFTNQWSARKYIVEFACEDTGGGGNTGSITLTCPLDINVQIPQGQTTVPVSWLGPIEASTTCPNFGIQVSQTGGPASGTSLAAGTYGITYTATDACGNNKSCVSSITVTAATQSQTSIQCPGNITVNAVSAAGSIVTWNQPSVSSTCNSGYNITQTQGANSGSLLSVGTRTITYSVTDNCGNTTATCSFTVTVLPFDTGGGGNPGEVGYTANDQVTPYTDYFRPGSNTGYNPPWTNEQLADIAAGNPALGINGIGAKSARPGIYDEITSVYGYDLLVPYFEHAENLGMKDFTLIVGFPAEWHRDQTDYCGNGQTSAMFRNLYTDIWDNGENGTPYNDENYYAAYLYEIVTRYKDHVKFWEIWNEPGFDLTGNKGWRQPGDPQGNWWDNDPSPCDNILRAPIEHYVRTLRISWEIIKTLAPDDYVIVAGVGFEAFLDSILRNTDNPDGGSPTADYPLGGGAYFDVMGFHSYPDIDGTVRENTNTGVNYFRHSDRSAQGIVSRRNEWQGRLGVYGYDGGTYPRKEMIITEINVPRRIFSPNSMGSDELQVNYIIKATVTAMRENIHQMHVYTLGDKKTNSQAGTEFDLLGMYDNLTSIQPYEQVVHQEGIAYKTASDLLFGSRHDAARTAQMNLPSNVDGGAFKTSTGNYVYVVWARTTIDQSEFANATYSLPSSLGSPQLYRKLWDYSQTNQTTSISTQNMALTGRPIFLTELQNPAIFQGRELSVANVSTAITEVFPNPAENLISFVIRSKEPATTSFDIYNTMGELVERVEVTLERGHTRINFDISDYPAGMYYGQVHGANQKNSKSKFIKQY